MPRVSQKAFEPKEPGHQPGRRRALRALMATGAALLGGTRGAEAATLDPTEVTTVGEKKTSPRKPIQVVFFDGGSPILEQRIHRVDDLLGPDSRLPRTINVLESPFPTHDGGAVGRGSLIFARAILDNSPFLAPGVCEGASFHEIFHLDLANVARFLGGPAGQVMDWEAVIEKRFYELRFLDETRRPNESEDELASRLEARADAINERTRALERKYDAHPFHETVRAANEAYADTGAVFTTRDRDLMSSWGRSFRKPMADGPSWNDWQGNPHLLLNPTRWFIGDLIDADARVLDHPRLVTVSMRQAVCDELVRRGERPALWRTSPAKGQKPLPKDVSAMSAVQANVDQIAALANRLHRNGILKLGLSSGMADLIHDKLDLRRTLRKAGM